MYKVYYLETDFGWRDSILVEPTPPTAIAVRPKYSDAPNNTYTLNIKPMKIKPIVILSVCTVLVGGCGKSPTTTNSSDSQPRPAPIEAEAFHGQVYKSLNQRTVMTLISKDECELNDNGTILLCKYTKQNDNLRVVITALGTSQVLYYRFTNQGLQDNNGRVLFSQEGLLEAQRQVELEMRAKQEAQEAADQQRAESQRLADLATQRKVEEQRLADEASRKDAPEKLRALLTTRPTLDGTYETGFGSTKLTLRVISFNSATASVSAEFDFPAANYHKSHSNHAEGNVSGDLLNLTLFDSEELTKRWMLMKLQFKGSALPAHPTPRLVGNWFLGTDIEQKGPGGGLLFELK